LQLFASEKMQLPSFSLPVNGNQLAVLLIWSLFVFREKALKGNN